MYNVEPVSWLLSTVKFKSFAKYKLNNVNFSVYISEQDVSTR